MLVWHPLCELPCCNAKGDVYAKKRILIVKDGILEDALYDIMQSIEEFTGTVTVRFLRTKMVNYMTLLTFRCLMIY